MRNWKKVLGAAVAAAMTVTAVMPVSVFAEGETFKIGGIGPISGGAAVYGQAVKNAAEIAVEEIN